jgi:uncharacterized protein (DUF1684 family)
MPFDADVRRPQLTRRVSAIAMAALCAMSGMSGCRDRRSTANSATSADANAAVVEWRAKHEADYRRDWASIAGLAQLKRGVNTAGSSATNDIVLPASTPPTVGRFVWSDTDIRFEPAAESGVLLKGAPVTEPVALRDDSTPDADELTIGSVRLVVHLSGERRSIRIRDPNGAWARNFAGFGWFPINSAHRVVARFIPDAQPQRLQVVNTYGDVDTYQTDGVVEFTLQGQSVRLRPFTTRPKRLYFVFRDGSSGVETYKTARFLYADLRDDGSAVLDFNEAYNPPCAFNPYTTCPIPLKENRLTIKILAGERAYAGAEPPAVNER